MITRRQRKYFARQMMLERCAEQKKQELEWRKNRGSKTWACRWEFNKNSKEWDIKSVKRSHA